MKFFTCLGTALCLTFSVFCQDITGLWKGTLYNDDSKQSLDYEVYISKEKGKLTGFSHTWFLINEKKYYGIKKLKVHIAKDGKIILQDEALVENNYPVAPNKNIFQLNVLDLYSLDDEIVLEGPFVTNATKAFKELTGHTNIKKVNILSTSDLMQFLDKNSGDRNLVVAKK